MAKEKQELEQKPEAMGEAVPEYKDDVEEHRWQIEHVPDVTGVGRGGEGPLPSLPPRTGAVADRALRPLPRD